METKETKSGNFIKYGLVISLLIVAFSIFYYLVIFLPKKQTSDAQLKESQQQQVEKQKNEQKIKLDECLQNAKTYYDQLLSANDTNPNDNTYTLPLEVSNFTKDIYDETVAGCNKLYND
ncbi:MAG: hypothetical protein WC862_04110 [Patescibacteria group bacterium]